MPDQPHTSALGALAGNSTWRRLFAAQIAALVGTGLTTVALALLAYDLASGDAGRVLGIAFALKMLAYVAIAPVVGAYASRLPRKPLLIGLDLGRAAAVFCLPLVTETWQIYALILWLNACSAGFTPTFQATIPDIVTDDAQYARALSASRLAYDLENLLSPTLAAAALWLVSYNVLFAANGIGFIASALLVAGAILPAAQTDMQPGTQAANVWRRLTGGVRHFLSRPELRATLALYLGVAAAGAMIIINTVLYVRQDLGGDNAMVAQALMASGAGSMLAALCLPRWLDTHSERSPMLAGGVLLAAGLMLGALWLPSFQGLLALWFLLGVGLSLIQTPVGHLLTRASTPAQRPALFSAQFALSHACWLIGYPLAGWLGSSAAMRTAMLVLMSVAVASTALAYRSWPSHTAQAVK